MRLAAVATGLLVASAALAAPQPRLALGLNRAICLDHDDAVPTTVRDAAAAFLRSQFVAATRGEAVIEGTTGCDPVRGDVAVRLARTGDRLGLTATDGQATYRDEVVRTGRPEEDVLALADRLFRSLGFEPHE